MSGKTTDCAEIRERMFGVASDSLSDSIRAAFDAHIGECAACAKEFRRVQILAQAINHSLNARLAVEPSPQLMANVRRQISAESHRETWWWQRSAQLTALGVCAALAILIFAVRVPEFSSPTHDHVAASIDAPSNSTPTARPRLNAAVESAVSPQPHKPPLTVFSHVSRVAPHRKAGKPEVIVQPGQMQAILRFAVAMQRGQIDGAQFLADQKSTSEPLEIKPLTVAPLGIKPLDADFAPLSSGENSEKSFVIGRSD